MKFGDQESKLADYCCKDELGRKISCILTDRRLVISDKNSEENYPLGKITVVSTVYGRYWWVIVIAVLTAFTCLADIAFRGEASSSSFVGFTLAGIMSYLWFIGYTKFSIGQMGGNKRYSIFGKDEKLMAFVDAVNEKLS
ncbi:MAG: hypothetical protein WCH20_10235 [Nitrospira sp.]